MDASELGSMYANAIELVSTDAGVGVRSHADVVAKAGNIQLQANGQLTVNGAMAATDEINVWAHAFENHGGMFSGGAMAISFSNQCGEFGGFGIAGIGANWITGYIGELRRHTKLG